MYPSVLINGTKLALKTKNFVKFFQLPFPLTNVELGLDHVHNMMIKDFLTKIGVWRNLIFLEIVTVYPKFIKNNLKNR